MNKRHVSGEGANLMFRMVLLARVLYVLRFSTLTETEMDELESPVRSAWLHSQSMMASTSRRRLATPPELGGMGWIGFFNEAMAERTILLMDALNSGGKVAGIIRHQL